MPLVRPPMPPLERVVRRLRRRRTRTARLTNGPLVDELEAQRRDHARRPPRRRGVACTAGLMLGAAGARARRPGRAARASRSRRRATSCAGTGWSRCSRSAIPASFQLDVADAGARRAEAASARCSRPTSSARRAPLERRRAARRRAPGSGGVRRRRTPSARPTATCRSAASVDAEVFSMSPSKVMIAGEGGLVATNRDDVADVGPHRARLRQPRRLRHALRRLERAACRSCTRRSRSSRSPSSTSTSRCDASSPAATSTARRPSPASRRSPSPTATLDVEGLHDRGRPRPRSASHAISS